MSSDSVATATRIFTPPGGVHDLSPEQERQWDRVIHGMIEGGIRGRKFVQDVDGTRYRMFNNAPRPQFYNPHTTPVAGDLTQKVISWNAFPRRVTLRYADDEARSQAADESRDVQDEYCEWSSKRDAAGNLIEVTFTAEGPEYWEFLAEQNKDRVLALYREFVSHEVKKEDLFEEDGEGKYIQRNIWNNSTSKGAMHLIQESNSLGAEVELAAGASMVRVKDGRILTGQQELIDAGHYGRAERNSDPFIGAEVNRLARAGAMISMRDPVGLYFDSFTPEGWTTPDGTDPSEFWSYVRGNPDTPVRAVFKVPPEKGYTISDIRINDEPIVYASEIVRFIKIKLVGIAQNIHPSNVRQFESVTYQRILSSGGPSLSMGLDQADLALEGADDDFSDIAYQSLRATPTFETLSE